MGTSQGSGPRKLRDYTLDEQNDRDALTYPQLLALRRDAYRDHVAGMGADSRAVLGALRERYEQMYGPAAKAHHNAVTWDVAFMVGRYGEAVEHWPQELTEEDRARVEQWHAGAHEVSPGIQPLGRTVHHAPWRRTLHGLEEFGDAITVVHVPAPEAPSPDAAPSAATLGS